MSSLTYLLGGGRARGVREDAGRQKKVLLGSSRQSSSSRLKANGSQEAATRSVCLPGSRLCPDRQTHMSVRLTLKTSPDMKQRLQDSYTNNHMGSKTVPKRKAQKSAELWTR